MSKKSLLISLVVVVIAVCIILSLIFLNKESGYIPSFKVVGDVNNVLDINKQYENLEQHKIKYKTKTIKAVKLNDLLTVSDTYDNDYDILLVSYDGLFSKLSNRQLEDSYISFSNEYGWNSINLNHPISSNIKHLKEIVVVSTKESYEHGFNIISSNQNILSVSVGSLMSGNLRDIVVIDGKSSKNVNGEIYFTEVYRRKKGFKAEDLVDIKYDQRNIVMGEEGDYEFLKEGDFFEIKDNYINLITADGKIKVKKAKGIYVNATKDSNMDVYYDTSHYLENNEKVMFIFLDGFSYRQYEYSLKKGLIPFMSKGKVKMASTVYKPVTNAGFAAMITGKNPKENGVYSRAQKDLKVPTIFKKIKDMNKKAALLEGNIKILNTEIEPILHLDKNNNGAIDDEILDTAKEAIKKDYDFILVHFHEIDDNGHSYGDLAKETLDSIKLHDEYIKYLVRDFKGKVIITADHGMHSIKTGGKHGEFRYEDMIVPYITIEGGGQ
ncbi:alkaline phosphatase family protein [Abyssisolibacter fermentans]|uniref:alkaline phosphatase family protein n=1 Tax=Abyssisolibacter fermentans TaxID=1766203 RepID=UPI00082A6FBC|nr:alkaline phosphatase family protein [Abyssisolibacter fermentans]